MRILIENIQYDVGAHIYHNICFYTEDSEHLYIIHIPRDSDGYLLPNKMSVAVRSISPKTKNHTIYVDINMELPTLLKKIIDKITNDIWDVGGDELLLDLDRLVIQTLYFNLLKENNLLDKFKFK